MFKVPEPKGQVVLATLMLVADVYSKELVQAAFVPQEIQQLFPEDERSSVFDEWFEDFDKKGVAGNLDSVPEPLRTSYQEKKRPRLDHVKPFIEHYEQWRSQNKK